MRVAGPAGRRILVLGGYGNTGFRIADLMLERTESRITLAARNTQKLESARQTLTEKYDPDRISVRTVDASRYESLERAFREVALVVIASSTARYAETVASAALAAGVDYLDVQYSTRKVRTLKSLEERIEKSGRCFITDGGFHPGLPAALVRYGARYFDVLETAIVGSVIKEDWRRLSVGISTQVEFVEEMLDYETTVYQNGAWKKASVWSTRDFVTMNFSLNRDEGIRFGTHRCAPMFLEEMGSLPADYPSLKDTGFYITGFNGFVDYFVLPFAIVMLRLFPKRASRPMARLVYRSLKAVSHPPFGLILKLEASGIKNGEPRMVEIALYHPDGYWFTAIPVVACLLQYLDGSIRKPGLWTMGNLVEPRRLMEDMERMGVRKVGRNA